MARITVEDCLQKIPNRFQLVLAATYRARMRSQRHAPKIESKNKPGVTPLRDFAAGEVGATALDPARAQIRCDACQGRRRHPLQPLGAILEAMLAVVDPVALSLDELAGGDRGGAADDRDQIALALDLDPQHAKARLFAVDGDALDGAREALWGCLVGGRG